MYDHVNSTIRAFNPNLIILNVGTNELKSSKKASQMSRSDIDLALPLKSETNTVTLTVPRKNSLNNKAQEVNSQFINMCGECDITFVDHTDNIDTERHLNESKVYLNKSGTINQSCSNKNLQTSLANSIAKNICNFLL